MEKVRKYLHTKYIVLETTSKKADIVYSVDNNKPVRKSIELKVKRNFNHPKNRDIILKALEAENIIITKLSPKTHNGQNILAGVGVKVFVFKQYKTKSYQPKEEGFTLLELVITSAIIATLTAVMTPILLNFYNNVEETHQTVQIAQEESMNTLTVLSGGE
jgi:prepilin-type N-terminal cleavage/methylation domain-containing protein